MSDVLALFIFIVGYYALMTWILPYFGVQTRSHLNYNQELRQQSEAKHKRHSIPSSFD